MIPVQASLRKIHDEDASKKSTRKWEEGVNIADPSDKDNSPSLYHRNCRSPSTGNCGNDKTESAVTITGRHTIDNTAAAGRRDIDRTESLGIADDQLVATPLVPSIVDLNPGCAGIG